MGNNVITHAQLIPMVSEPQDVVVELGGGVFPTPPIDQMNEQPGT